MKAATKQNSPSCGSVESAAFFPPKANPSGDGPLQSSVETKSNVILDNVMLKPELDSGQEPLTYTGQSLLSNKEPSNLSPVPGFLVEDDGLALSGQITKTVFLAQLHNQACQSTEEALTGTAWSAENCPYLERFFNYLHGLPAQEIESLIQRHQPEAASASNAEAYLNPIALRIQRAVMTWVNTGSITEIPSGLAWRIMASSPVTENQGMPLQYKSAVVGNGGDAASAQSVSHKLSNGQMMDSSSRTKMEGAFGTSFGDVRLHTDTKSAQMAQSLRARAFTVGTNIAFAQGEYEPGSLVGDALVAHELAHVVQQRNGNVHRKSDQAEPNNALETEADNVAVGVVAGIWGGFRNVSATILPRLKSGLKLQRCTPNEKELSALSKLQKIKDKPELIQAVRSLNEKEIQEVQEQTNDKSEIGRAVRFEKSFKTMKWGALVDTIQKDGSQQFIEAYRIDLLDLINRGQTTITIEGDTGFKSWVGDSLYELANLPSGFRLILELLTSRQTVKIKSTAGENATEAIGDPDSGRLITTNDNGALLPVSQQKPGTKTGSTVSLNSGLSNNLSVLSKDGNALKLIEFSDAITLGHELIHALHRAKGTSISPPLASKFALALGNTSFMVNDPATGEPVNPEELRSITGQTQFQAPTKGLTGGKVNIPLSYNLDPASEITENMLRRESGQSERAGHKGAVRVHNQMVKGGVTVDAMLGRYSLKNGKDIPPIVKSEIRSLILEFNPYLATEGKTPNGTTKFPVYFPHENYVALHIVFVKKIPNTEDIAVDIQFRKE